MLQYHASMQDVDHAWAELDDKQYSAMITDTADQTILINTPAMQTALIAKVPSAVHNMAATGRTTFMIQAREAWDGK